MKVRIDKDYDNVLFFLVGRAHPDLDYGIEIELDAITHARYEELSKEFYDMQDDLENRYYEAKRLANASNTSSGL